MSRNWPSLIGAELRHQASAERAWFAGIDVVEQLLVLGELHHGDDLIQAVTDNAVREIEYLRGFVASLDRGARPLRNLWDQLRERDCEEEKARIKRTRLTAEITVETAAVPPRLNLWDLPRDQCYWPIAGDTRRADLVYCGAVTASSLADSRLFSKYCADHAGVARRMIAPRKAANGALPSTKWGFLKRFSCHYYKL